MVATLADRMSIVMIQMRSKCQICAIFLPLTMVQAMLCINRRTQQLGPVRYLPGGGT